MATEYWLALTLCLSAANGSEICGMRLVPLALEGPQQCPVLAAMIMRVDPAYRLPMICSAKKPDLPVMPATIPPGRWA